MPGNRATILNMSYSGCTQPFLSEILPLPPSRGALDPATWPFKTQGCLLPPPPPPLLPQPLWEIPHNLLTHLSSILVSPFCKCRGDNTWPSGFLSSLLYDTDFSFIPEGAKVSISTFWPTDFSSKVVYGRRLGNACWLYALRDFLI